MRLCALIAGFALLAFTSGCEKADQKLYESAVNLLEFNKYDDAVNKLTFLVAEYPESPWAAKAYFKLGEINYFYFKKPEAALDNFVHAAGKDKKGEVGLKAQKHIAKIYLSHMRNHELAILQYQKILQDFEGVVEPEEFYFLIGKAYYGKRDYKQAIIEFRSLADKFPHSELRMDALYYIAACHLIDGRPKKAVELYTNFLKIYHGAKYSYDARLGLAMSYEGIGDLEKALSEYKKMGKLFPDNAPVARKIELVNARIKKGKK